LACSYELQIVSRLVLFLQCVLTDLLRYVFPENVAGFLASQISYTQPTVWLGKANSLDFGFIMNNAAALALVQCTPVQSDTWNAACLKNRTNNIIVPLISSLTIEQSLNSHSDLASNEKKFIPRFPMIQPMEPQSDPYIHNFFARVHPTLEEPLDWFEQVAARPIDDKHAGIFSKLTYKCSHN